MTIYEKKTWWKLLLLVTATVIVGLSLWYTNSLTTKLAEEERKKVELWANAYKAINTSDPDADITFYFEVIRNNTTVPVILVDEAENILAHRNLDSLKAATDTAYLQKQIREMKLQKTPISIDISKDRKNYIYYKESFLLTQLRFYPYVQFGIIGIFLLVAYLAFSTARKAEQNQVWVGMSKETAHQLGTPVSSLIGWAEYLKEASPEEVKKVVPKISRDVKRLEAITDRFSKIGSMPVPKHTDIIPVIQDNLEYIKNRSSRQITFTLEAAPSLQAMVSPPLFGWVLENLLTNALNAMEQPGKVTVRAFRERNKVIIEVSDTGHGIPRSKFKTVFKPGYTTRKRGWGLGLPLCKRIIEQYHHGSIYVHDSAPGRTTFRIELQVGE